MTLRFKFPTLLSLILAVAASSSVEAHNGHTIVARPISDITIDGDLSDWPSELKVHPIATTIILCDGTPQEDGFSGRFRVGCNHDENTLYVAVEITDDTIVLDGHGDDWNSQDGCEIFVGLEHSDKKTAPVQFVYRGMPSATYKNLTSNKHSKSAKVARKTDDNHLTYEWRIDLNSLQQNDEKSKGKDFSKGAVVGFDVSYLDRDTEEDYAFYSSSPRTWKHMYTHELADLVIPPAGKKLVEFTGTTAWNGPGPKSLTTMLVRAVENENVLLHSNVSAKGEFSVSLPPGEYDLVAMDRSTKSASSQPKRMTILEDTKLNDAITFEVALKTKDPKEDAAKGQTNAKIYYDLAHGQRPVPQLKKIGEALNFAVHNSDEPITAESLNDSNLLYLRAPTTGFADAEKAEIVKFVRAGGSLLLVMDEQQRTSLKETGVNEIIDPFGLKLTEDTKYLHNCGAISKAGMIHKRDLEVPYSGGRSVAGGKPFAFQLDRDGKPSHPYATSVDVRDGGRVIVVAEGMASLFLGSKEGERLSGDSEHHTGSAFWGKDSERFNTDLIAWLLANRGGA